MADHSTHSHGTTQRKTVPHRRLLLKGLAALPLALPFSSATAGTAGTAKYQLKFRHTHTDELLDVVFRDNRGYIAPAIQRMNWLLRDYRSGEMIRMDPQLFDILYALRSRCGGETFEIISAYRSPVTNALMRSHRRGVAKNSLHMDGRAIDVRLVGFDTARLSQAAVDLGLGGVGYYPKADFLHVDTGDFRTWGAARS
ncbi:MAG: twin-arginine translocation pathway signal sequence domain-containing protein [Candidatus Accumulibacter phosphatis]|uniref:Murein endopeptidase K n=1 Tax=Candidatus Accumulibacter phosphatis TaxID=327160 RepID=A0A6A7RXS8_9PROT|nr:twin-arginine translocation pathway signal sequence domain-containing protein [Candidatus Accumulibacter phosphatis]